MEQSVDIPTDLASVGAILVSNDLIRGIDASKLLTNDWDV